MACSTQNNKTSSKHAKNVVSLGQRQINITRNATGPKMGRRIEENFNLKGSSPIGHKWPFIYFLFYLV